MKLTRSIGLLCLFFPGLLPAETFIGSSSATNRLLVASNSAVIITTTLGDFTNSTQVLLGPGGLPFTQSYFAPLESGNTYAVAGPAELIFSNAVLFTFFRVTNSTIRSQGIANDPIGVLVPTNKTMHLFGVPGPVNASFQNSVSGRSINFTLQPNQPAEFCGPGTLSLNSGVFPPYAKFISYYFAEDGFAMPGQRPIAGPTGSFGIIVEQSADMDAWSPVLMQNTSDATQAYYRLRIAR
jgi:hypothetical protein